MRYSSAQVTHKVTVICASGIDCLTPVEAQILNYHRVYDDLFELFIPSKSELDWKAVMKTKMKEKMKECQTSRLISPNSIPR